MSLPNVLLMRNDIFRDVTKSQKGSDHGAIKQKEARIFLTSKTLRYFRTMEDELIDYGFEEDSVRTVLSNPLSRSLRKRLDTTKHLTKKSFLFAFYR